MIPSDPKQYIIHCEDLAQNNRDLADIGIGGRVESIQITVLFRSARILRALET